MKAATATRVTEYFMAAADDMLPFLRERFARGIGITGSSERCTLDQLED